MKTFIEFETIFDNDSIIIKDIEYSSSNFNKLDGSIFDVYEHFGNENIITVGRLYWDEDKNAPSSFMISDDCSKKYFSSVCFTMDC